MRIIYKQVCKYIGHVCNTLGYHVYVTPNKIENISFFPEGSLLWMQLQMIILSEVSQKKKDKYHMISLTCGI